jgi:amino acid transporter
MTINLVSLLIGFLVFFLLAYGVRLMCRQLAAPPPVETIVLLILLVVFIFWLLGELGVRGPVIHVGDLGLYLGRVG